MRVSAAEMMMESHDEQAGNSYPYITSRRLSTTGMLIPGRTWASTSTPSSAQCPVCSRYANCHELDRKVVIQAGSLHGIHPRGPTGS